MGSRLDPAHPINVGQVACYLLNEGQSTTVLNLVNGSFGTFFNSPTWTDGQYGPALTCNAASSQRVDLGNWKALTGATKATMFVSGSRPTAGNMWSAGQANYNGDKFNILVFSNNNLQAEFGTNFASVSGLSFGQFTAGLVYDGSGAATWAGRCPLFFNGRRQTYTSTSGTPGTSVANGSGSTIGFEGGGVSRYTTGSFDVLRVWNRALSDDDMLDLHNDPFLGVLGGDNATLIYWYINQIAGGFSPWLYMYEEEDPYG